MSNPTCLIRQANCGRVAGEPVCPKCGLDANARYVSEESGLLAASQAEAKYWQYEATQKRAKEERLKLEAEGKRKAEEATKQAENERLIKARFEQDEAERLAAEQAQNELLERQREGEESKKKTRNKWLNRAIFALMLIAFGYQTYLKTERNETERHVRELDKFVQKEIVQLSKDTAPTAITQAGATPLVNRCDDCPEMVVVPGGSFQMGSNDSDEKPVHSVNVKSFAIGKYEVTRNEFAAFVSATKHETGNSCDVFLANAWEKKDGTHWRDPGFTQTKNDPVLCVNWHDAMAYVKWLKQKTGTDYRLPSEAEWEYACRGGKQQEYCGSNDVDKVAVYGTNSAYKTLPKGSKDPNDYGLYDMSGNVWEWTEDWYHDSYSGAPSDGSAWVTGGEQKLRVIRGGSWGGSAGVSTQFLLATNRGQFPPDFRTPYVGFRVAMTVP